MPEQATETFPFIEVSMACSDIRQMEEFWERLFDGKVIFRGRMMGLPYSRLLACGINLALREDPDFQPNAIKLAVTGTFCSWDESRGASPV